jgi:hypothetical protein
MSAQVSNGQIIGFLPQGPALLAGRLVDGRGDGAGSRAGPHLQRVSRALAAT